MTSDAWILRWTRPRADWNPHKQNPRQALPKQDLPGVPDTAVVTPIGDGLKRRSFFVGSDWIYSNVMPAASHRSTVSRSHKLACTSPMWQVPSSSMHRRDWPMPPPMDWGSSPLRSI